MSDIVSGHTETDGRTLKRIAAHGPPIATYPCTWRKKQAAVALTNTHVVIANSGGSSSAPFAVASISAGETTRRVVGLYGERHDVEFSDLADVNEFTALLQQRHEAIRQSSTALVLNAFDRLVTGCTFVGGAHLPILVNSVTDLVFGEHQVEIYSSPARKASTPLIALTYSPTFELELSGPGKVTQGGRFIGGGFGLLGAAEGMAIAGLLNAITTKTSITTVIVLADSQHEGFFVNSTITPGALRQILSPVYVKLRQRHAITAAPGLPQSDDLTSRLERLAALYQSGALSDQEFADAKSALLRGA